MGWMLDEGSIAGDGTDQVGDEWRNKCGEWANNLLEKENAD